MSERKNNYTFKLKTKYPRKHKIKKEIPLSEWNNHVSILIKIIKQLNAYTIIYK